MLFIQTQFSLNQTGRCRVVGSGVKVAGTGAGRFLWDQCRILDCHGGQPVHLGITRIFLPIYTVRGFLFLWDIHSSLYRQRCSASLVTRRFAFLPKALMLQPSHRPIVYIFHTAKAQRFFFFTHHQEPVPYCHAAAQSHIQSITCAPPCGSENDGINRCPCAFKSAAVSSMTPAASAALDSSFHKILCKASGERMETNGMLQHHDASATLNASAPASSFTRQ